MKYETLLAAISEYCRRHEIAESTFGRRAVNDGKLVQRLREGRRITVETLERIQGFIGTDRAVPAGAGDAGADGDALERGESVAPGKSGRNPLGSFRFFDNRQKYLLFVNTCSEKRVIAQRVTLELASIDPQPPAVRVFDAGAGDGTVLSLVLRAMHGRFPHMPFYVVAKEVSLEDVRLTLDKIPDRLIEHPASVVVITNMYYREAPWLTPASTAAASNMVWREIALNGSTSAEFETQLGELQPFLDENWRAYVSPRTGNPVYERPIAIVLYRADQRFLLDSVIPKPGRGEAGYDLIIASQPYRASAPLAFKARRVIAPLARALQPGGRLIGIHAYGHDPGMDIVHAVWPDENPFITNRHDLLRAVRYELGSAARTLNFNAYADSRSIFRYSLEMLPHEVSGPIGTSTAFAAWNAAIYVAQVDDDRLNEAAQSGRYLDVTREVLRRHGGLWFNDESFVISRRRA